MKVLETDSGIMIQGNAFENLKKIIWYSNNIQTWQIILILFHTPPWFVFLYSYFFVLQNVSNRNIWSYFTYRSRKSTQQLVVYFYIPHNLTKYSLSPAKPPSHSSFTEGDLRPALAHPFWT